MILIACAVAAVLLRAPRLDRDWDEDVRVLADVVISEDGRSFTMGGVRDWRYDSSGPTTQARFTETYAFADLAHLYFFEQVLDARGYIAHTFIVFEFRGDYEHPLLGVSVETRREVGENYSLLKGALRGFELTHTWASASDLIVRRVRHLDYALSQYAIDVKPELMRQFLLSFLHRTQALASQAQWYNTITSNCTNIIIDTANRVEAGALPFDKSFVLTGLADEYLIARGILQPEPIALFNAENLDAELARFYSAHK